MRLDRAVDLAFVIGLLLAGRPAAALQFDQVPVSATELFIAGRGPIVKDDTMRLEQTLAAIPPTRQVSALTLDSPGGNVVEGELLARLIRTRKLTVVIPPNGKCVSACFLLLAASPRRLAAADALIGVHGASEGGEETVTALAVTTRMARDAASLGIPPAVIGKMVQTAAGRVEWLTHADLASMDVSVFDDDMSATVRQMNTQTVRPLATPLPGPPVVTDQPVEAEYQGAFFCGRQVARLTLKVFPQSDEPRRRAVFSFGPQPTSPEVPRGAFIVEGSIGLDGGVMSLTPVRWVSQPAGFNWLGLSGNSDDGGKTFGGRIVDNGACTVFTLKRIDDVTAAK